MHLTMRDAVLRNGLKKSAVLNASSAMLPSNITGQLATVNKRILHLQCLLIGPLFGAFIELCYVFKFKFFNLTLHLKSGAHVRYTAKYVIREGNGHTYLVCLRRKKQ